MALSSSQMILLCAIGITLLARPAHAFGAGNIGSTSKIEGQNWRHGDLEDTLLTIVASRAMGGKKFGKLDVKRVYFGNWLRDYSQAVDVGTVKYVSAEAIRILLWVLGFMSFGYGSGEFEVTTERLGCYRPEEHIDNPKDYAENEDARQYDRRLRGPVDERRELAINEETGLKNYIASEDMGIDTSAGLVRKLFRRSIELGRQYTRNKNKDDLYEALRLLGTACHCLEDYAAHSNYVELALIELGERNVFPHVGRRTEVRLREARREVYPIVTGTFGGVDFLHSVCGEFDDKATQSEIEELDGALQQYQHGNQDNSILQDLLNKVPDGIFGGKDQAGKADELKQNAVSHQMQNTHISPREPEEWTRYLQDVQKQIYPIIEWHDDVMQSITETIEKIPILPDLLEQLQEEVNKFVFSLIAPYVLPIINQVKSELNTGSNEIIQSSKDKQHIVFSDDESSDPTHSMLSKDHFSNVLNEPAGKIAQQIVKWVVPQIVACWDDDSIDIRRTNDRIIHGVLHHPALRDYGQDGVSEGRRLMFGVVEGWWREKSEREKDALRDQLSRRGVESGKNHKEGVHDHGHGSNRPLTMANLNSGRQSSGIEGQAFGAINQALGGNQGRSSNTPADQFGKMAGEAVGGGVLGSLVGNIASGIGGDILGGGLDKDQKTFKKDSYGQTGSRTETVTQVGHSGSGDRYGQAQYSRTTDPSGRREHEEYNRFEQRQSGGRLQSEVHHQERTSEGGYREETRRYGNDDDSQGRQEQRRRDRDDNDSSSGGGYGRQTESSGYGESVGYGRQERPQERGRRDDDDSEHGSGYGRQEPKTEYSSGGGYAPQAETSYGSGGYGGGREEELSYESRGYGGRRQEESGYGRQEESGYGGRRQEESSYGRQEDSGYGGRRQEESNRPSGYGESRRDGYGSGGGYGSQQGYGSSQRDEDLSGGGYGRQQGRGESDEYGSRREKRDSDDDDDEKRRHGGGRRRRDNDNDDNENPGYGGGYGGSRY